MNVNEGTYPSDSHNGGLSYLLQKNLSQDIDEIIAGLPEQCRNIFKLSRYKGLRTKEIAEIYAISPRTVETQIYRALKVLRKKLQHHMSVALLLFAVLFH
jgi:RNA polymerase sigma-70 factor (ECF subfamily)